MRGLVAAAIVVAMGALSSGCRNPSTPPEPHETEPVVTKAALKIVTPPTEYAWVDKEHGIARIPIDRAMDILADTGLPWGPLPEEPKPAEVAVVPGVGPDGAPAAPAGPTLDPALVQVGQALFTTYRCAGCHAPGSQYPPLNGKYGTMVPIEGGQTVLFDDEYIRESLLTPNAKVALGYRPVMTNYTGRITDDEIRQIIVYIRSLK